MSQAEQLSPLKQAFLALEKVQHKLDRIQQAQSEPIAITGMACRFPNGANTPAAFWQMLCQGRDAVTEIPPDRWPADAFYDPDPQKPGKIGTRWGGFLDNVTDFDARFFGISPREAIQMDPQQRLLLEVAWEALERAGQPPDALAGSLTGVYVGLLNSEYGWLQLQDVAAMDAYSGTGSSHSVASGRLSYCLGLHGPSVTLDTACSSSLAAMHMACQALRARECHLALAGGVTVMLSPLSLIPFTRMGLLAADGRCKTLDAGADGIVGGEGCALLVLKRLSDAQADGDPILALIRGSAVNQDGRTNVLSAPNGLAQVDVIRQALANARLEPGDISFLEMHGTGTVYGDPIEVDALRQVFGNRPADAGPLPLGAVKSNIGHTAAAAGVAGVIKTVLALQHDVIPPNLHFRELNPHISLDQTPFSVPVEPLPWPPEAGPRYAGVSAFGWSGTNVHLILSDPPPAEPPGSLELPAFVLPLSARDSRALRATTVAYRDHLQEVAFNGSQAVADIVYTAAARRSHHTHRLAVTGRSHYQLAQQLRHFLEESDREAEVAMPAPSSKRPKLVFAFSPHGSQWQGMGRRLWGQSATFREAITTCEQAMSPHIEWSLVDKFSANGGGARGDSAWMDQIDLLQPTLFALQIGLAAVWRAWGIEPDAVVGHSMGEVAAAHVAGVLSLDDAARIICRRTQLLRRVRGEGAMGVVELSFEATQAAIAPFNGRLNVAVSNSPRATVVAGEPAALEELFDRLQEQEIFCGWGVADVASHSPHMAALRDELWHAIGPVTISPAHIPLYSTVSGALSDGRQFDQEYWVRHLSQPVLFAPAVRALAESGHQLFLELGPGPVLAPAIEEGLQEAGCEAVTLASLQRNTGDYESLLNSLGRLYRAGYPVEWSKVYPHGACVDLPGYPWQRERYWVATDNGSVSLYTARHGRVPGTTVPILGERLEVAQEPQRALWQAALDRRVLPSLFDYTPSGTAVLPPSTYLEAALNAALHLCHEDGNDSDQMAGGGVPFAPVCLVGLQLHQPLLPAQEAPWTEIQLAINRQAGGQADFSLYSREGEAWTRHAGARIAATVLPQRDSAKPAEIVDGCDETVAADTFYRHFDALDTPYGAGLQIVEQAWRLDKRAVARLRLPAGLQRETAANALPTAVIEPCFQLLAWCLTTGGAADRWTPTAIGEAHWLRPGAVPEWVEVSWQEAGDAGALAWACLLDGEGEPVLTLADIRLEPAPEAAGLRPEEWFYEITWQPLPLTEEVETGPGLWLIWADGSGVGTALAEQLRQAGHTAVVVEPGQSRAQIDSGRWRIQADLPADYEALLAAVLVPETPCLGIVYLWGLESPALSGETAPTDLTSATVPLLHLVQALKKQNPDGAYPLWLVTQGAQPVNGKPVALAQAPLWGLGYVLAEEHRELWGGLVDLDPAGGPAVRAQQLKAQVCSPPDEDRVAFRQGERYVARLARYRTAATSGPPSPWRADAAYLVTGGFGEVALEVAPWAVAQGARRLVLLGRTPLPPRAEWTRLDPGSQTARRVRAIQKLEAMGAAVHWAAVDVSNEEQLYAFLDRYAAEGRPPIRGVIHAAAVIEDRLWPELDAASLERVLRAKSWGAWLLHRYFDEQRPLDFFILFSSIASVVGSAGQASYAGANAFLDALAHSRRAQGLPALSINWGFWGDVGFATTSGGRRVVSYMRNFGLAPLTNSQALDTFGHLLARPELTQLSVLRADWQRWREQGRLVGLAPLLRTVTRTDDEAAAPRPPTNVREQLWATPPGPARAQKLQRFLRDQLAGVLKIDPAHIEAETPLGDLGIDSFTAIELRNRLERSLAVSLSATVAWNYPTISAMTPYLAHKMGLPLLTEETPDALPEVDQDIAAFLNQVDTLSDEDLRQLLNEE
jgi:myxalamid-type polyketide synthase MxaD